MPLHITVIIPAYKSAPWIEKTLQSVLEQTYPHENLELLVIDDRSPDNTVEIARKCLEGADIRNEVSVREKNGGPAASRNQGWRVARGEWIQFLDHDDLLAPHKLALQAQAAAQAAPDVAVLYSPWQHLALEGGTWQPSGHIVSSFVDDDPILRTLQDPTFGYVGPTLIRKEFLQKIDGFREAPNLAEDDDLMLRLAMAGGKFRKVDCAEPAFFYRRTPGSLWQVYNGNVESMRNYLQTYRRTEEFLRKQSPNGGLAEEARQALARRYSKSPHFFQEKDPESFKQIMQWLRGLGMSCPPTAGPKTRMISRILGYENTVRLRSAFKKLVGGRV
jgi:glycosyltransferase involved in cell wall biosynthesis